MREIPSLFKHIPGLPYIGAVLACLLMATVAAPLRNYLDLSNIVMLFLLAVLLVATRLGRGPAILAAFLSVALFDFFFVPPRLSFSVQDAQYLITFAVMLAVALITGQLTAGLRRQAEVAQMKQTQTRALYEMAREVAGALTLQQLESIVRLYLQRNFNFASNLLIPGSNSDADANNPLIPVAATDFQINAQFALIAFEQGQVIEDDSVSGYGLGASYFPLQSPLRLRGVLVVTSRAQNLSLLREQKPLLLTLASLIAIAVERLHYVEVAQTTQVENISERLRSSILSALSHDLRTPLTVLVSLVESLTLAKPALAPASLETATQLREQLLRLNGLVGNLLDMARLHAGQVRLRKEWQPLEEVIGASLQLLGPSLTRHAIQTRLASDLPLLEFDAVLMERVFCNLLENAAKYTPAHTLIEIAAQLSKQEILISVCDRGPGFPLKNSKAEIALFDMFVRGESESTVAGAGLGLAICRAIVEAHGGSIHARMREGGGACVEFSLPLGSPPAMPPETELLADGDAA